MRKQGLLLWAVAAVLLSASATSIWAAPKTTTMPKAGNISALLPVADVVRGVGKKAVTEQAKKGDELVWNDLVKTEKGGRARITLNDQSILSLGSQAELRIVKHDAKSQQTTLQMAYGRVRAQVASITRNGGSFELRTPTAVAGVIGTDFGVDSSPTGGDTFVCLAGAVQVSNSDPSVPGSVQCTAGQTTTVMPGKAPSPPKPASLQQLQQLIQDTEPAIIASVAPAAALPGTSFDSVIAGTQMGRVTNVSVAGGSGVSASLRNATDTSVTIHIVVDQGASAGPRTITLAKESGAPSATVFTVLGTPVGDPKKAYLDTMQQLKQTGVSGLGGFLTGAQQAADQVAQQITSANENLPKPLDLTPFATSLNQQYGVVSGDLKSADGSIDKAAADAANTFSQLYYTAYQGLLQRDPAGNPDTTFRNELTSAFQQANAILQTALTNSQSGLNSTVQTYGSSLDQIQQTWSQNINQAFIAQQAGPLPKVNALERVVELGTVASFDAGSSAASNPAISITSFQWTLCAQSYQPNSFGQMLDPSAGSCVGISGYQSSGSEFQIPTCSLQPGNYFARLAVTDSNSKISQMDVRLTVLQPNYGPPSEAVRGLADSYSSLQLSQFLRWFDSTRYNGYTILSENIRKTLQDLSSMNINLRVSQENVNCNDATVRADWQQNYSFLANPSAVLSQAEQLSVRLQRTPGVGWLITDFQGDNGTVQGVPPVISSTDVAAPDLTVSALNVDNTSATPNGTTQLSPGPHTVQATIANVGKGDLTSTLPVEFSVQDSGGRDLITPVTATLAGVTASGSTIVTADINVPDVAGPRLVVTVNPSDQTPEQAFANNASVVNIEVVHQPDLAIGTFTLPTALQMGQTFSLNVPVSNSGLAAVAGWDIVVTLGGQTVFTGTGPTIATGGQVSIPVQFIVPQLATSPADLKGTQAPALVITINGNKVVPEINTSNNTASNTIETADFTLTTVPTAQVDGIAGRPFNTTAVSVAPSPYPLALTYNYAGLPAGLAGNSTSISGTPSAVGRASVTASGSVNGVTHNASAPITINIGSEVTITPAGTPGFFTGGPSQNLTLDIAGGVYPVTVALTLPTGFTTTSGTVNGNIATQTLTGPGQITYALTASTAATQGNQNFTIVAADPGIPATQTPAANLTFLTPYTVTGLPDLQFDTIGLPGAFQMGATVNATIPVKNTGVAAAAAGWDLIVSINGQTAGTATGPAIAVGQTTNVSLNLTIPQVGTAPVTTTAPLAIAVNSNQAIQEINTANNTFSSSATLVDFVLNTLPTGTQQGVVGRAFTLPAVTIQPTPYPLGINITYTGLAGGLAPSTVAGPNGLTGATIVGTPTAAGSSAISIFGNYLNVTHGANATFPLQINSEITLAQSGATALDAGGPAQNLTLDVTGGVYPVSLALTLPSGITTSSGTVNGAISTITLTRPGQATWALQADFTAATGTNLPITIVASDGGFAATGTPAGSVSFTGNYSVGANAKYVITGVTIPGHTAPYTGTNAIQLGENFQIQVTVANQGNGTPSGGTVTVLADCGVSSFCPSPLSATGAAPAAGSSTTISIPGDVTGFHVGSYPGSISLNSNVAGAVLGGPFALPFDVVDFTFSPNLVGPPQNVPIGGSAQLSLSAAPQFTGSTPPTVNIVPVSDPNLTFLPPSQNTIGANITFQVNIGSGTTPGPGTITFNGTNHGVTKPPASIPVNYFTANMTSTTLFVNDQANPLSVPMAVGAQTPVSVPSITFKMNGNFVGGAAALSVQQPACGNFTVNLFPTSAQPTDLVDAQIFANAGNTCPAGTPVIITAQIPQTQPPTTVPVYTLYVTSKGLPQLQVIAATPARDLSSQPWLSGEPLDWTVTVKNLGSGPSNGGEKVTIALNNAEVGVGTIPGSIAAGQQVNVNVHTVASDVPEDFSLSSFGSVRVSVATDTQGDLAQGSQDFFTSANISNWGIQVNGNGSSDSTPLTLTIGGTTSDVAVIGLKNPANTNTGFSVSLVTGSYSSNQLSAPGISPTLLSAGGTSNVTVSFPSANSPLDGVYFVQVIAQLKDGATVTAQRQATIHVHIANQFAAGGQVVLTSDRNNLCPGGGCAAAPATPVQINGPLPEALTLTGSLSFCSGSSCPGTADVSFTDTFATTTTPPSATIQVTSPGNTLPIRVKAADNPDGSINPGAANVQVSVTAVQANSFPTFAARTPTPDPLGTNQFQLVFNIGDLEVSTGTSCAGVVPQSPTATSISPSFFIVNGFNVPSVAWEWEDANHIPVGGSPLQFNVSSGTSTFTGNGYTPLPTFTLSNLGTGIDGVQTYYFAVTVANGLGSATKYFPFQFDLSQSQTFCPVNLGAARGGGGTVIKGSWGRAGLLGAAVAPAKARVAVSGRMPDLRINAGDVSFTPSLPKPGDTVAVRFRISNMGEVDAKGVPVALQVNGVTVATDTFDVGAGRTTLAGLEWVNVHASAGGGGSSAPVFAQVRGTRGTRGSRQAAAAPSSTIPGVTSVNAALVVDPQHTIMQKTTIEKSAALAHFAIRPGANESMAIASLNQQRALLELSEGGCAGLKFALGAGSCFNGDVTITVEDLAKGTYKIESPVGVADLSIANSDYSHASFSSQVLGQSGHTYAVQLRNGSVATLTMQAVRNPEQLSEAAKRLFRQQAARAVRKIASSTGAPEAGDTAGKSDAMVYFDIVYQGQ